MYGKEVAVIFSASGVGFKGPARYKSDNKETDGHKNGVKKVSVEARELSKTGEGRFAIGVF